MGSLFSLKDEGLQQLKKHLTTRSVNEGDFVYILCAAWCGTCDEFRQASIELAQENPSVTFIWLDIEDDSEVAGDIDVDNFPSIAVFRGGVVVHYGVSLPHKGVVQRLLTALLRSEPAAMNVAEEVRELPKKLQTHLTEQ